MVDVAAPAPDATPLVCYGSSGTCALVVNEALHQYAGTRRLAAYVDDTRPPGTSPYGDTPIIGFEDLARFPGAEVFLPIFDVGVRRSLHARVRAAGYPVVGMPGYAPFIHPATEIAEDVIISSTTRIGPATRVAGGVIALCTSLAHDVTIGAFTTLGVNAVVLGHVDIGANVWVGPGAIIGNGTAGRPMTIGDGAVIGMGAVVDRPVGPGEVVVGNRAMPVREWAWLRRFAGRRGR